MASRGTSSSSSSFATANNATTTMKKKSDTTATASALVIAASDKAGMEGIDRSAIDKIILRESAGSLYIEQQRRRDHKVDERISKLKKKLSEKEENANNKRCWKKQLESEIDGEIPDLLSARKLRSTCVVVDMDMFYMACEMLTRPDLKDKPACVGGRMILTSNYRARKYGVRSAMGGWIGDKLVEELSGGKERLIHVPSNFDLYKEKSAIFKDVCAEYDPVLRDHGSFGLDEAYLDIGPYLALKLMHKNNNSGWNHEQIKNALVNASKGKAEPAPLSTAPSSDTNLHNRECFRDNDDVSTVMHDKNNDIAKNYDDVLATFSHRDCLEGAAETLNELRHRVFLRTGGLTCSAGLAPNFMLAKIGSDFNKPNGQTIVGPLYDSDVLPFLRPLPIRKIPGIGRVTEKILNAFSLDTVRDLFDHRAAVRFLFKPATARFLLRVAVGGYGSRSREKEEAEEDDTGRKGISRERTFAPGQPWQEVVMKLEEIAQGLCHDMKRKGFWAHTITLKVKLHTFDVFTRARTLKHGMFVRDTNELYSNALDMLRQLRKQQKSSSSPQFSVRLLGIRCSNLIDEKTKAADANQTIEKFFWSSQQQTKQKPPQKISDTADKNYCKRPLSNNDEATTESPSPNKRPKKEEEPLRKHDDDAEESGIDRCTTKPSMIPLQQHNNAAAETTKPLHGNASLLRPITPNFLLLTSNERPEEEALRKHDDDAEEESGIIDHRATTNPSMTIPSSKQERDAAAETTKPLHDGALLRPITPPSKDETTFRCPLCHRSILASNNDAVNKHIDSCLNSSMVRKVVREESGKKKKRKKCHLTDFFGSKS